MSHVGSVDDEIKKLLAETNSNDSAESDNSKKENKVKGKTWVVKNEDGTNYETNDLETPDSEW